MRILVISNTPHNPNQGSGYVITGYVDGLRERGHTVDAYGPEDYLLYDVKRGKRYIQPLMMAWSGLQKVRENDYDLVECWGGMAWILEWLLSKMRPRPFPLVHRFNGIEAQKADAFKRAQESGIVESQKKWYQLDVTPLHEIGYRSADALIAPSHHNGAFLDEKRYVSPERTHVIPDPLPNTFLDRDVSSDRENRIGYCGTWIDRKGTAVMEQDIARFLRRFPEWTFSIVGVGQGAHPERAFPEDVRSQIDVIPFLKREKLAEWYHSLAVFVLPAIYEGSGLVAREAIACGAALVGTRVGYAASLEHEESVMHLPFPQSPHLLEALTALAEDDALRRCVARGGYESVQDLRWDDAVTRLEAIYESLISDYGTSA